MLYNERKKSKKNSVKLHSMFLQKRTIYSIGFHLMEGMLFLIPVLPSSLNVRVILVGFYFLFHKYWSWKKSILNQHFKDPTLRLSTSTSTTDLKVEDSDYYLM